MCPLRSLILLVAVPALSSAQTVTSPDGRISAAVSENAGTLKWTASLDGTTVIESSPLGFTMNGVNLGQGLTVGGFTTGQGDASFPSRHGVHETAVDRYESGTWEITHAASGNTYQIQVRAYDSGIAFRYELLDVGAKNFTAEATGYTIPAGTRIFSQRGVGVYEDIYGGADIASLPSGLTLGPPVVGRLTSGVHFAITQSGPGEGFPSPFLQKGAGRLLTTGYVQNADNTRGASTGGPAMSPWNIVTMGTLDELVNSDVVEAVAPAPDPTVYPGGVTPEWARSGRSVWDWMSRFPGGITPENSKLEALWASRLGFEFITIDEGWGGWNDGDPWAELEEVVQAADAVGVEVLVWVRSRFIRSRGQREEFFGRLQQIGVRGIKADFFDFGGVSPSSKERVRLIGRVLHDAARHELVVNLHGFGKPMGQFRTYPNLLNIEGVFGKESFPNADHTVQLPLTRLLAGPSDYTPLGLQGGLLEGLTPAFEIASVASTPGPLITFAERADRIAQSPFGPVIAGIPTLWDETRVLEGTTLGESCAMARRTGDTWYLTIMNAGATRDWTLDLDFLAEDRDYQAEIIRDGSAGLERKVVRSTGSLEAQTLAGGGLVVRFALPGGEPVSKLPFETTFSTGRGSLYAEDGEILSQSPWANDRLASRLPDLMWSFSGDSGLSATLDETDAWQAGGSLQVTGTLDGTSDLALFDFDLTPGPATRMGVAFKSDRTGAQGAGMVLTFEAGPPAYLPFPDAPAEQWTSHSFDLSPYAGRRVTELALRFDSSSAVSTYDFNLGRVGVFNEPLDTPFAPSGFALEDVTVTGFDLVEGTLTWTAPSQEMAYYSLYQASAVDGTRRWLGVAEGTSFPVTAARLGDEAEMIFQIRAVASSGAASGLREIRLTLPPRPLLGDPLAGTVIGTAGSFQGAGNTRDKAFDRDTETYFDADQPDGVWTGLDLGTARTIRAVRFFPRDGWSSRMVGGIFQGSDTENFANPVTLATVTSQPVEAQYTLMEVEADRDFRYVRYLSPAGGWGNIAEIEFLPPGAPEEVPGAGAQRTGSTALIEWVGVSSASGYRVKRSTEPGGPFVEVAGSVSDTYFFDEGLSPGTEYFYVVSTIHDGGVEGPPSAAVRAVDLFYDWLGGVGDFEADADGNGLVDGLEYALLSGPAIESLSAEGARVSLMVRDDRMLGVQLFASSNLDEWREVPAGPAVMQGAIEEGFRRVVFEDMTAAMPASMFYQLRLVR